MGVGRVEMSIPIYKLDGGLTVRKDFWPSVEKKADHFSFGISCNLRKGGVDIASLVEENGRGPCQGSACVEEVAVSADLVLVPMIGEMGGRPDKDDRCTRCHEPLTIRSQYRSIRKGQHLVWLWNRATLT